MRTNRDDIRRMTRSSAGAGSGGTGGGAPYALPLAADGVRGGVQIGYTTSASAKKYAVQLDSEKMYVEVTSYPWASLSDKPATATRWPSWSEVTSKPATATRWPSWSEVTSKPASKTAWGQTYLNASSEFQNISGDLNAGSNGGAISQFHSIELNSAGSLSGYGGFIDFHFNGSSSDYTSRIIEDAAGEINIDATIKVNRINSRSSVKALSDARHKDVKRSVELTVEQIAAMPAVIFEWLGNDLKSIDPGEHVGTLAQEWQKILPQAVSEQKDGTLTMGYGEAALVSVITLARRVLKLVRRVLNLSRHVLKLERRVLKLEKEIKELKKQKECH